MRSILVGVGIATTLAAVPVQAATIGLTLTPDVDPMIVAGGETITWTVGISPATVITGYTLDIRYDMSELTYIGAEQLVPLQHRLQAKHRHSIVALQCNDCPIDTLFYQGCYMVSGRSKLRAGLSIPDASTDINP